jgi:bifunctional non-homologous end joining protein LigD
VSFKPMLAADTDVNRLVTTDERRPGLDRDDAWCYQQKYNGDRVLVAITLGQVDVFGRDGQRSQWRHKFATRAHQVAYRALAAPDIGIHHVVLDGELMPDGTMVVFDVVHLEGGTPPRLSAVQPSDPYRQRLRNLTELFDLWAPPDTMFRLAPTAVGTEAKLALALDCVRRHTEGVMARRLDSVYRPGVRSQHLLKLKFIHDADLVVMSIGFEGRDNVVLGAYTPDGTLIEVGRASAHGKGTFAKGDVLVVRYNYMSRDGRLTGPRILRKRTDKRAAECTTDQLFYSQEVPVHEH